MSVDKLSEEDEARAGMYALLARLYYAPPDADVLAMLASREQAPDAVDSPFARALSALAEAARGADPVAVAEEFEALFGGPGRALVTPYASAYLSTTAPHAPLVGLRRALAEHGLERRWGAHQPEDHFAALCDALRHLVLQGDIAVQKKFFEHFLVPAVRPFCTAVRDCDLADFYRPVAELTEAFAELEHEAFQMD